DVMEGMGCCVDWGCMGHEGTGGGSRVLRLFFFQAEDGIRDATVTGVQTCALPISEHRDRAAVFLRAAELLAGPWRQTVNAATMLGQSKTAHQAEIDAACELIDFWR